ncbi:MAG TPA: TonB family protein [Opitutaceae bacterium]|jgi:protein TonB|nr:TonB family protein [Opitutaceae bacterium]
MNKDILIAGTASLLLHGAVALYSLALGHAPAAAPAAARDTPVIFQLPPPPADPVYDDDSGGDSGAKPSTAAPAAPSLPDIVSDVPSPILEKLQPTLPPAPIDPASIPQYPGPGGSGDGPPIFAPGELSRAPVAQVQVPPNYPYNLKRQGIAGQVVVSFIVDARGTVHHAFAVQSEYPEFAAAAVAAVFQWHFQPGIKDGRAVATRMQVPIVFNLNSAE